jgi:hypothetical protein
MVRFDGYRSDANGGRGRAWRCRDAQSLLRLPEFFIEFFEQLLVLLFVLFEFLKLLFLFVEQLRLEWVVVEYFESPLYLIEFLVFE